ncbi:MAG: hypothetical protein RL207_1170 [Bacteroidota bacterium]|jgi:gliding motility-associated-like protein
MKKTLTLILTLFFLATLPKISYSQIINLGTAANYAIYSTGGAVTNSGTIFKTRVTGNVGTSSDPTLPGFGNIDGQLTTVSNLTANTQLNSDLLAAYNDLNTAIPTFFPASLLGNGQTLIPGVYSISVPSVLNLTLTLDGQNNPNAVFIIKVAGSFSTNANAKVKLINGALACNVYWKIEGAVNLGTGTHFKGTIVANNAAIVTNVGDTLEGRAFAIQGAITVTELLAYIPSGCGSATLNGPTAPNLNSAGCFALFTSNGANTNTGISNVIGDVGTNGPSDLTTGYNPLLVSGIIHPIPDLATAQAATELLAAYNFLVGLNPGDVELVRPDLFGHNLVLTPHTYLMLAAVTFTDTLYLDARGNTNAVFVINVNGAFSTNVGSKVLLINGAQAKNVFWKIDGAVSIGSNSIFNGTLIVSGAINLMSGVQLNGRALTISGAINAAAVNVSMPTSCSPQITIQPISQTVCLGNSVSFSVGASGAGLTYQWRKGTVDLVNSASISGATSATLTINPTTSLDAGSDYYVIVSGTYAPSVTSVQVSLLFTYPPVITTQPVPQTLCTGSTVNFNVAATGSNLTYQWRIGTVNLVDGGNISGTTTSMLTINPTTPLDVAPNYNVLVSGTCPVALTSVDAALNVNIPPLIATQPISQTLCLGSTANFNVSATGTNLTYQWRIGTVNLVDGGNISGTNTSILTINPTTLLDVAPNYNVLVSGTCPVALTSVDAALNVNIPPLIATQPISQTLCLGSTANFNVSATGTNLTYQWRIGTVNLVDGGNISGTNTSILTINPTTPLDVAPNYNVLVSGTCPVALSSVDVGLNVNIPPLIATQPISQTLCLGSTVNFNVSATGTNLTYQWRIGTVNLVDGGNISGTNTSILTINPTTLLDVAANYNVLVSGTCPTSVNSLEVALTITLIPSVLISSDSVICHGSDLQLTASFIDGATYAWTGPNDFSSTFQSPTITDAGQIQSGTYFLSLTILNCSSDILSLNVNVVTCDSLDFFIPEGFSPNNDGINDFFVIRGIQAYPSNDFVIYSRWGDELFEQHAYNNTWDGNSSFGLTFGSDLLPVGTYFYILHLNDGSAAIKGTIYLNR